MIYDCIFLIEKDSVWKKLNQLTVYTRLFLIIIIAILYNLFRYYFRYCSTINIYISKTMRVQIN